MARKRYEEEPENHERWIVSYADFITLLFAFFVVMYALSSLNESKYKALSESLGAAFGNAPAIRSEEPPPMQLQQPKLIPMQQRRALEALRREKERMTGIARDIMKALAPLVSQGKVRVTQTSRGVSVEINASVLFAPAEAKLTEESSAALKAVAEVLKDDGHAIQVEGHTDSIPINNAAFPSNWELSAVRASSVVRLFVDSGVAETRLTAVGHGPTQPAETNDTAEGRQRNRRVTVTIMSSLPDVVREVPVEAPSIQ
ncbi:flagellar motor protein MotD [Noviherbaspirillum massiliense]|uniref:flagellar motor protein MotD n=1 Tax=Noviherbaspirillum massiliense TaxID=1465823 RepID=UPI0002D736A9|nr:flagellar motor protein MotD [Noviherbaspirillum massiliense]